MSIVSEKLYLFAEELQTVLSPTVLQELAKQVGFVQHNLSFLDFALDHVSIQTNSYFRCDHFSITRFF